MKTKDKKETSRPSFQRLLTAWSITSVFIPFVVFAILDLTNLDLFHKLIIVFVSSAIWSGILLTYYILDWDQNRKERLMEICKSDALLKLWKVTVDIARAMVVQQLFGKSMQRFSG